MRFPLRLFPFIAIVATAACDDAATPGGDSATGDATPGGTLVIASPADADILLPGLGTNATSLMATDMMFDRLAEIGRGMNVIGDAGFEPRLAQRWTWAPDSLSLAFELHPQARWHDGRPVRASDVAFTFRMHRDPAIVSQAAPNISNIDSVTVRDSLTAVYWFAQRMPQQFFSAVYHTPVLPEHVYGAAPLSQLRGSDLARRPVGSGRFRFVRWDAGSRMEVMADTGNYRGRAQLDRVVWTIVGDPAAALARLTAGEADYFEAVPADRARSLDSLPTIRVFPYPSVQYAFMGMNLNARRGGAAPHPIFGDVRVRRALTMATNRQAMLQNVFSGFGAASYGPFPSLGGVSDTTIAQLPFDTVAAAALLDSAGWRMGPNGVRQKNGQPLRFSLLAPQSSAARMAYAVLLQDQFKRVGASAELETVDFPTFVTRSGSRDYDAALQGWGSDPGPNGFRERWTSDGAKAGGINVEGYRNPLVDARADSAMRAYDAQRARAHMRAAYEQIIADAPGIWLYDIRLLAGAHERLRIPPFRSDKWWAYIADWHIPESARLPRDRVGLRAAATP